MKHNMIFYIAGILSMMAIQIGCFKYLGIGFDVSSQPKLFLAFALGTIPGIVLTVIYSREDYWKSKKYDEIIDSLTKKQQEYKPLHFGLGGEFMSEAAKTHRDLKVVKMEEKQKDE